MRKPQLAKAQAKPKYDVKVVRSSDREARAPKKGWLTAKEEQDLFAEIQKQLS